MTEREQKALDFLRERLDGCAYLKERPADLAYRWEHSLRVAGLCGQIARAEGLDEEGLTIAGLLHDVAYGMDFPPDYDWREHGRDGARIARPFLERLGLPPAAVEEICYGIAIHVDDRADFPGQRTPFALTVGDADNIDRFDVFRLYENLWRRNFYDEPLEARLSWLEGIPSQLDRLEAAEFATPAAAALWREKLAFQREFFARLLRQTRAGTPECI